jgi:hypothetical protein
MEKTEIPAKTNGMIIAGKQKMSATMKFQPITHTR